MTSTVRPGEASRVAAPDEAVSLDELRLAARNHGMPLEALRFDLTPPGLHYLHYDIPFVDPSSWRLSVGGHVGAPLELDLPALMARPRVEAAVTLECAGNGRARPLPRPVSQPWLGEAVGTARWAGTDGGQSWTEAGLGESPGRSWSVLWDAEPGEYELCARATDELGVQPVEPPWNVQGMANNTVQRVPVTVR
jgi:hypothetical protein